MVGGINEWALMKIKVLDELETIKVCIGYEINGKGFYIIKINKFSLYHYEELPDENLHQKM